MAKIEPIIDYCQKNLSNERTGHDFFHAQRVARTAEKLMTESLDQEVVIAASYLHDLIDDKVVDDIQYAKEQLAILLLENDFTEEQCQHILKIIQEISFSYGLEHSPVLTAEGKIVQDADRLDALGAIGIMRTAYYGGSHGSVLYNPQEMPRQLDTKKDYRKNSSVINHFYEKLFTLSATMQTAEGKKEALRRERFMRDFLREFYEEWHGDAAPDCEASNK